VLQLGPATRTLAVQDAADKANAEKRKVKGTVKLVEGNEVWVSLGTNNGFAKGDKIRIYQPINKTNKKGEVVATTYAAVGEITLTKVQKDKSMGEYGGSTTINEDWPVADVAVDIESLD